MRRRSARAGRFRRAAIGGRRRVGMQTPGCGISSRSRPSIAGSYDPLRFDHQYDGALRRAGAMDDTLRHGESLLRRELNRAALKVDQEFALHHVEELVLLVVLVPVE